MWKFLEKGPFFRADMADWGNTAWADMAGLGSIGLNTGIYMFDMNRQYRISWFWDYLYAASDKIFRYLIPTGDQLKIRLA